MGSLGPCTVHQGHVSPGPRKSKSIPVSEMTREDVEELCSRQGVPEWMVGVIVEEVRRGQAVWREEAKVRKG